MTIKQVIVVRTDLNMNRGKIAGQVAHADMPTEIVLLLKRVN